MSPGVVWILFNNAGCQRFSGSTCFGSATRITTNARRSLSHSMLQFSLIADFALKGRTTASPTIHLCSHSICLQIDEVVARNNREIVSLSHFKGPRMPHDFA